MINDSSFRYRIKELDGFGLPAKRYDTVDYANQPGITTTGSKDLARTLTITCDIKGGQRERNAVLRAFYYPGTLFCKFGNTKRKIDCKCSNMSDIELRGRSDISTFTVQLQCDWPYFEEWFNITQVISDCKNTITGTTFTLPCVFSEYLKSGTVENLGDLMVYPTIKIKTLEDTTSDNSYIIFKNDSTGNKIKFKHSLRKGDVVTINVPERKIISSKSGNIINTLTDDSDLGGIYLQKGKNKISFDIDGADLQLLHSTITFNPNYIMAQR